MMIKQYEETRRQARQQPNVVMVARTDSRTTGLARYVYSLADRFMTSGQSARLAPPLPPPLAAQLYPLLSKRGIDVRTFFKNYPVRVNLAGADVCHLTSQNLATLLCLRPMPPTVVTVHDLHYLIERINHRATGGIEPWVDRLAVAGLKKAHAIIAISAYTKQTISDLLHYPAERIHMIHCAVDTTVFRPLHVPTDFRARYGLPSDAPLILYLGSEDPRKNLATLLEAFRRGSAQCPEAVLVKAGAIHFPQEAARLRQYAKDLGIASRVVFIENLPDQDLPLLYNTADIFVIPSLLEGFGFPALEAMACGKPVIASRATSLPEVVGEAGVLFDPYRSEELAMALIRLLEHPYERRRLGEAAVARARTFSLACQATQTWDVYCRVHQRRGIHRAGKM
jgi:glycosyltransferase involved in cell wall biosynthesis